MPLENVQGNSPLLLCMPYTGTNMQRAIVQRLNDESQFITAPDRYLDRLIGGLHEDVNFLRANFHRYMSDVDYPFPKNDLTPVKGMIGVVPLLDKAGRSIWRAPPSKLEAASWRAMWYAPYHAALATQIARIRARFGHVVLVNCRARPQHSPRQFNAVAADINLSTNIGASCAIDLSTRLGALLGSDNGFSSALHGRINTGWTIRHYGRPATGVHALDLELNEGCYLAGDDDSLFFDTERAAELRSLLGEAFDFMARWRPV